MRKSVFGDACMRIERFRKGRSTVMAVKEVVKTLKDCRMVWAVLVTVDIENPFNIACHGIIILQLRMRTVAGYLVNLVSNYLQDRKLRLIMNGRLRNMKEGVRQGSFLGPTLWNILYDAVLGLQLAKRPGI